MKEDTFMSNFQNPSGSTPSIDNGFRVVVLDVEVGRFVETMDSMLDDLSYELDEIILAHSRYRHNASRRSDDLANELYASRSVSNYDDAITLANHAITVLFPEIDDSLREMGLTVSGIRDVELYMSPARKIRCNALVAVI